MIKMMMPETISIVSYVSFDLIFFFGSVVAMEFPAPDILLPGMKHLAQWVGFGFGITGTIGTTGYVLFGVEGSVLFLAGMTGTTGTNGVVPLAGTTGVVLLAGITGVVPLAGITGVVPLAGTTGLVLFGFTGIGSLA